MNNEVIDYVRGSDLIFRLFALFSAVPATMEMVIAFLVLQMNIMQYK